MIKTLPRTSLPERCWIFYKKRYILKGTTLPELPWVSTKYECILKANGIPYKKVQKYEDSYFFTPEEVCEYWNPEFGLEEFELSLPLFAAVDGSYVNCEKKYCKNAPTSDTLEAAAETKKFVESEICNYEQILRDVRLYRLAKICLSGDLVSMVYKLGIPVDQVEDIEMNHDKFKILSLQRTDWVAIFDMNKVAPNGYITLQVPKDIAGFVIGKAGTNIQSWAKELGVKRINVVPI